MIKIVYFIASHTNPTQVARLCKTIITGSPTSTIVIHHDETKSHLDPALLQGFEDNIHFLPKSIPGKWGTFSLVEMTLYGLTWINNNIEYDWLIYISGQDYPIQPLNQLENYLQSTRYDAFINGVSLLDKVPCDSRCPIDSSPNTTCFDCHTRYNYQYYDITSSRQHRLLQRLIKSIRKIEQRFSAKYPWILIRNYPEWTKIVPKFGIVSAFSPFGTKFTCYKGAQWFTVNKKSVKSILHTLQHYPRFVKYYRRTLIPDESFFQTLLLNQPELVICPDNKRFIPWTTANAMHPDTLTTSDFEKMISSDCHFARKFDVNSDAKILDMLDQHINTR